MMIPVTYLTCNEFGMSQYFMVTNETVIHSQRLGKHELKQMCESVKSTFSMTNTETYQSTMLHENREFCAQT